MKLGILGVSGRMGQTVKELADARGDDVLGWSRSQSTATMALDQVFMNADVVVDYTQPQALTAHLTLAQKFKRPFFLGVTGLTPAQHALLETAAQHIPLLYAPNASFGMAVLNRLVRQVAKVLDSSYDIEITEAHHRYKQDIPSGATFSLAQAAGEGRGASKDPVLRDQARQPGDIGVSVMRGGTVKGQHTVHFLGDGERLTLSHEAEDRSVFAKGTLQAVSWLRHQQPGRVYHMFDVFSDQLRQAL